MRVCKWPHGSTLILSLSKDAHHVGLMQRQKKPDMVSEVEPLTGG